MCHDTTIDKTFDFRIVRGVPELLSYRKVCLHLSRQSKHIYPDMWWFRAIQAVLRWCRDNGSVPLVSSRPLYQDVIRYVAQRSGPIIEFVPKENNCCPEGISTDAPLSTLSFVPRKHSISMKAWYAMRDSAMNGLADRAVIIKTRRGGSMEKLVRERLRQNREVYVLIEAGQSICQETASYLNDGARPLELSFSPIHYENYGTAVGSPAIIPLSEWRPDGDYLWHCTRDCPGPWPGQSWEDYVDALLMNNPESAHSAVDTLARIVRSRVIRASSQLIRGNFPVVCFTEHTPSLQQTLRRFYPHRGLWQFLAYAIGIRKEIAWKLGARPVKYGSAEDYLHMPEENRFLFQRVVGQKKQASWWSEREWRILGDVDLSTINAHSIVILIHRLVDASALPPNCPWTILKAENDTIVPHTADRADIPRS